MNNIKSSFSIKDLENLSGIKAHTIRIWEKRYNLLQPDRTETNIRTYDLESLQKLLNISYLNNNGYKISKIAKLPDHKIPSVVKEIALSTDTSSHSLSTFKLAMLNFDQGLFYETYKSLSEVKSFEEIFHENLVPLLNEIGFLWQTDTITPANEHFITTLIRQKLTLKIEEEQSKLCFNSKDVFVLFLPSNEIHELGLMFLNYTLLKNRIQTIYLGQSVPMDSLVGMLSFYDKINFVSFFTVKPDPGDVADYISQFNEKVLVHGNHELWVIGRKLSEIRIEHLPNKVLAFKSIETMSNRIIEMSQRVVSTNQL